MCQPALSLCRKTRAYPDAAASQHTPLTTGQTGVTWSGVGQGVWDTENAPNKSMFDGEEAGEWLGAAKVLTAQTLGQCGPFPSPSPWLLSPARLTNFSPGRSLVIMHTCIRTIRGSALSVTTRAN